LKRWGRLLEGLAVSSALIAGPLTALVLVLAEYARFATLAIAMTVAVAGHFLRHLAERRVRKPDMRRLRREIGKERRAGRLCVAIGLTLAILALILPPWIAVALGLLGAGFIALRGLAVIGDSANKESDLKIGNLSPADECPHIEVWARRIAALPGQLPARLGSTVNDVPAPGKIRGARLATLALTAGAVLAYVVTASALLYKEARPPEREPAHPHVADKAPGVEPANRGGDEVLPTPSDRTYENECPELPDPLEIGHELGGLFRFDGAFKAGCGTEPQQVLETDAWFSRGICAGRLRSVAIAGLNGEKAILYGAAATFALHAARTGELVSAEGASPAGGDVYVVETLTGSFGFARQAATSEAQGGLVRDCRDVTGTARPFAELPPPMLLLWRNLLERHGAWSWPIPDGAEVGALTFVAHSEEIAAGACVSDFSCYLEVDGIRWPGDETAYVSLAELPHMPLPAP
jgi:hypothetical protein